MDLHHVRLQALSCGGFWRSGLYKLFVSDYLQYMYVFSRHNSCVLPPPVGAAKNSLQNRRKPFIGVD